ncbi:hypothetical protein C8Q80DRAFT_1145877 [Daedaleopsis nitida]|nr:hypothetical protein C8Q80DRAFT_1145877 [Daedaleopsis nitida]
MTVNNVVHAMMDDVGRLDCGLNALQGQTAELANVSHELTVLGSALTKASSRLRQLINALSPINRLPPEIFAHIATFVPRIYGREIPDNLRCMFGLFAIGTLRDIARLTEVCHRWRDTLINCAKLWAVVDDNRFSSNSKAPRYSNYIHRNPTGPLFLYIEGHPSRGVREIIKKSGKRTAELRVSKLSARRFPRIISKFPADALTACTIDNVAVPDDASAFILFNGHAPQLRVLRMESLAFIPSDTSFPCLTHLLIHTKTNCTTIRYTFAQLLDLLRGCATTLQTLYLCELASAGLKEIPMTGTPTDEEHPVRVVLPRLRQLSIMDLKAEGDSGRLQVSLCSYLTVPAECFIYIGYTSTERYPAVVDAIERQVSRELTQMRVLGPGYNLIDLHHREWPASCVSIFELTNDAKSQGIRFDVKDNLSHFNLRSPRRAQCPLLCAPTVSSDFFSNIEFLYITPKAFSHFTQCEFVVRGLSRLKTLSITDTIRQLHTTLAPIMIVASGGTGIVFPHLTTLIMFQLSITEVDDLYALVHSRREAGYPLSRLVFGFQCVTEDPTAEQLFTLTTFGQLVDECTISPYAKEECFPEDVRALWESPTECSRQGGQVSAKYWPAWNPILMSSFLL